jgi:hypothetical protein
MFPCSGFCGLFAGWAAGPLGKGSRGCGVAGGDAHGRGRLRFGICKDNRTQEAALVRVTTAFNPICLGRTWNR